MHFASRITLTSSTTKGLHMHHGVTCKENWQFYKCGSLTIYNSLPQTHHSCKTILKSNDANNHNVDSFGTNAFNTRSSRRDHRHRSRCPPSQFGHFLGATTTSPQSCSSTRRNPSKYTTPLPVEQQCERRPCCSQGATHSTQRRFAAQRLSTDDFFCPAKIQRTGSMYRFVSSFA
jgi:hypothetical protein